MKNKGKSTPLNHRVDSPATSPTPSLSPGPHPIIEITLTPLQKFGLGVLFLSLTLLFLYRILDVLFPFLASFIIAYLLHPLVEGLRENFLITFLIKTVPEFLCRFLPGPPRLFESKLGSFTGVMLFFLLVIIAFILLFIPLFSFAVQEFEGARVMFVTKFQEQKALLEKTSEHFTTAKMEELIASYKIPESIRPYLNDTIASLQNINISGEKIYKWAQDAFDILKDYVIKSSNLAYSFLFGTFSTTFGLLMIPVFVFFILKDYDYIIEGLGQFLFLLPTQQRTYIQDKIRKIDYTVSKIVKGQIVSAAIFGLIMFLGLTLLKVPKALILSMGAGIANLVPYLGTVLISIPTIIIIFMTHGWFTTAALTLLIKATVLFFVVGLIDSKVVMPRLVGKEAGLVEVEVFFTLSVCGSLLGFYGLIFAIPIAAIVKEIFRSLLDNLVQERIPPNGHKVLKPDAGGR